MIRISQLKLPVSHKPEELKRKIIKTLGIKEEILLSYEIKKQSIDARRKPAIFYVYTVDVSVNQEKAVRRRIKNKNITVPGNEKSYTFLETGNGPLSHRPVIIGTGPAGLFCGYQLASLGYRPILLERGASVDERVKDVEEFWNHGTLNLSSNIQFGEGGAGTFSDGKLNTLVKDPSGRNKKVLEIFVQHGAPKEILYQSKPHIGTDILTDVVKNMRESIIKMGGEVRFHAHVVDFCLKDGAEGKEVSSLVIENPVTKTREILNTDIIVLAIGHSARDTFQTLHEKGIPMEVKSFAVGVRIEHPQSMIDKDQYGIDAPSNLPPASYKLTANLENGRGVYTFCMCPGGYVVNASSEEGHLAVNGMSYHSRSGANANSAVIVTVTPEDFGTQGVLSGVRFQRQLEKAAYQAGRGSVPVQRFEDFCMDRSSKGPGTINPQIKGAYTWSNVRNIFPDEIAASIESGIRSFDTKLPGYANGDAVIAGIESRTSSPVRILRDESFMSSIKGFYPCGEGAGYAGGITSAAMDGLKVSEAVAKKYRPFDKHAYGLRNF